MFHFFARQDIFCSAIYTELLLVSSIAAFIFPYSGNFAGTLNPGTIYLYNYFG